MMPTEHLVAQATTLGLAGNELVAIALATEDASDQLIALDTAGVLALPQRTSGRVTCCLSAAELERALELPSLTSSRTGVSPSFTSLEELRSPAAVSRAPAT